ncbi:hypothetical protein Dimus_032640 [Dionaea muscipula]
MALLPPPPNCASKLITRADDIEAVVKERLRIHKEMVMRSCLPDLFDAQPDLLFQLLTMLNPSVLVENGIPVYNVLQVFLSFNSYS